MTQETVNTGILVIQILLAFAMLMLSRAVVLTHKRMDLIARPPAVSQPSETPEDRRG